MSTQVDELLARLGLRAPPPPTIVQVWISAHDLDLFAGPDWAGIKMDVNPYMPSGSAHLIYSDGTSQMLSWLKFGKPKL